MSEIVAGVNAKLYAIRDCIDRWSRTSEEILSPLMVYREEQLGLRRKFEAELKDLAKHTEDSEEYNKVSHNLINIGGEMKQLEMSYLFSALPWELEYRDKMDVVHRRFAFELIYATGLTLSDPVVQTKLGGGQNPRITVAESSTTGQETNTTSVPSSGEAAVAVPASHDNPSTEASPSASGVATLETNAAQHMTSTQQTNATTSAATEAAGVDAENNPNIQANTPAEPISTEQMNSTSGSSLGSETGITSFDTTQQTMEVQQPGSTSSSQAQVSEMQALTVSGQQEGNEGETQAPIASGQQEGNEGEASSSRDSSNHQKPSGPTAVTPRAARKRPALSKTSTQQPKRPRNGNAPKDNTGERVIEFDKVFQDGNAQSKYLIAQFPLGTGQWYILECKQHNKHFVKNPIQGAAAHLASNQHKLTKEHSLAVRRLGTRVLHCNAALAKKNNMAAKDAFRKGLGYPPASGPAQNEADSITISTGIISPLPGEIYAMRYPTCRFLYPIFVLSWENFVHFQWKDKLLRVTPSCYLFDKTQDEFPRGWAPGYEDGGPLVNEREYPVMYFDGRGMFPDRSDVGWVHISEFKVFDPEDTNIGHRSYVAEFLRNKDSRLIASPHVSLEQYIVISDSESDDPDTSRFIKQEGSKAKPARNTRNRKNNHDNGSMNEQGQNSEGGTNSEGTTNEEGPGHDAQAQADQTSNDAVENNEPDDIALSHNRIQEEDIDQGTESLPSTQTQTQTRDGDGNVQPHAPPPDIPSASMEPTETGYVTAESSETRQPGSQQQVSLNNSSVTLPPMNVEEQQFGVYGTTNQPSQLPPQGSTSQYQHQPPPQQSTSQYQYQIPPQENVQQYQHQPPQDSTSQYQHQLPQGNVSQYQYQAPPQQTVTQYQHQPPPQESTSQYQHQPPQESSSQYQYQPPPQQNTSQYHYQPPLQQNNSQYYYQPPPQQTVTQYQHQPPPQQSTSQYQHQPPQGSASQYQYQPPPQESATQYQHQLPPQENVSQYQHAPLPPIMPENSNSAEFYAQAAISSAPDLFRDEWPQPFPRNEPPRVGTSTYTAQQHGRVIYDPVRSDLAKA